ncbi:MAG TPA: HEAT repeat domain-containing protein [Methylomirabilota bacterium]|nr:HEAT repeat domain-containing protein [Methylomirabilota bacterium]
MTRGLLAVLAALMEAGAGLALWAAGMGMLPLAAALHGLATLSAAWALAERTRPDERLYVFGTVLALPGLGLLGVAGVRLWAVLVPPTGIYEDMHSEMGDLPAPALPPESVDRVSEWVQQQVSVQPLADLIRAGDPRTQRWAIDLLGRRGDGAAVDLLREALGAADRDVQMAASAALQRVEERLTREIARGQERLREEPDSATAWHAFGEACRAYWGSHLLDPTMGQHWLGEAEAAYRRARARRPGWLPPTVGLVQTLMGLGKLHEAEALAREAEEATPSGTLDLLLAEVLFRERRWAELGRLARGAVAAGRQDERLAWWAGAEPPRGAQHG